MKKDIKTACLTHKIDRLQRRLKNIKKLLCLLAIPFIPVLLPIGLLLKSHIKKKKIVYSSFMRFHIRGEEAAFSYLKRYKNLTPPGTEELFVSMSAKNDSIWLETFNSFCKKQNIPQVSLSSGNSGRFYRIGFNSLPKIQNDNKVSVLMATYNCELSVKLAVESILKQTWENLELIIVDDCSTDNTLKIIELLATLDSRIVILRSSINAGPYVAKNRALKLATGTYITGHDADDIALPNRLQKQIEPILADVDCDATLGYMIRLDEDGKYSYPVRKGIRSYNGICRLAYISLMLPKEMLTNDLGFWDTVRFGADSEMIARVQHLLDKSLRKLEIATMLCLDHDASISNDNEHGIQRNIGLSETRRSYHSNWQNWHRNTTQKDRYLPFPHNGEERMFVAPPAMRIASNALPREIND